MIVAPASTAPSWAAPAGRTPRWEARWPGEAGSRIRVVSRFRRGGNVQTGTQLSGVLPGAVVETVARCGIRHGAEVEVQGELHDNGEHRDHHGGPDHELDRR